MIVQQLTVTIWVVHVHLLQMVTELSTDTLWSPTYCHYLYTINITTQHRQTDRCTWIIGTRSTQSWFIHLCYHMCVLYNRKVLREENLANHERFIKLKSSKLLIIINSQFHLPNFPSPKSFVDWIHQTFLPYGITYEIAWLHAWTNRFRMFFDCNLWKHGCISM